MPRPLLPLIACLWTVSVLPAQQPPENLNEPPPEAPESVAVDPVASDQAIAERLRRILVATAWFESVAVQVDEGVVFLEASADSQQRKSWAGDLARNTEGVVAVVNRISIEAGSLWDLTPAWNDLRELSVEALNRAPLFLLGLLLLALTWWATRGTANTASAMLEGRFDSQLLRNVAARALAVPVFLLGVYLALRVSGLSNLAVTVLGGTGLIGLIIGFAFRDIAENFLASLMISVRNPFATGDFIDVAGHKGLVQSVNTRSTLLMTLEGNHVQIPNATIFKETIVNFTANPKTRFDFSIGIGYDDSIEEAQRIALSILRDHKRLVAEDEPWIVVENLGAATINLRVYFWVNTHEFNGLKVRSAVIRAIKKGFEEAGVSMPDEAREVVFPSGVPVRMLEEAPKRAETTAEEAAPPAGPPPDPTQPTEGDLTPESVEIEKQAEQARTPEGGRNLLEEN